MADGDTAYCYKDAHGYQYVCVEGQPFYDACVAQGFTCGAAADATRTIFPGGDLTNDQPIY